MDRTTLTVKEVADYIGVSKDLVYKLVREKEIPAVRIGRRLVFRMESIEKWMVGKETEICDIRAMQEASGHRF